VSPNPRELAKRKSSSLVLESFHDDVDEFDDLPDPRSNFEFYE
jgi:hypothetical protein